MGTSVATGLGNFWHCYAAIGMTLAILVCVVYAADPNIRQITETATDGLISDLRMLLLLFVATMALWPLPVAILLWMMNDDDGPWKG